MSAKIHHAPRKADGIAATRHRTGPSSCPRDGFDAASSVRWSRDPEARLGWRRRAWRWGRSDCSWSRSPAVHWAAAAAAAAGRSSTPGGALLLLLATLAWWPQRARRPGGGGAVQAGRRRRRARGRMAERWRTELRMMMSTTLRCRTATSPWSVAASLHKRSGWPRLSGCGSPLGLYYREFGPRRYPPSLVGRVRPHSKTRMTVLVWVRVRVP